MKSEWTERENKDEYINPDDMGFSGKEGIDDGETEDNKSSDN